jgi:DNA-directed RNA polymerase specialized sigma24 family protein
MGRKQDRVLHDFVVGRFPEMRRAAYLMCGDWRFAEDLARAVLAKIVAGRRRRPRKLDALARRRLMHAFRSRWRTSMRRRERLFIAGDPGDAAGRVRDAAGYAAGYAAGDTVGDRLAHPSGGDPLVKISVLAALHQLPPKRRAVMVLHHWEHLSLKETAATLGMSVKVVEAHSTQGTAALRAAVAGLVPGTGDSAAETRADAPADRAVAVPAGGER